MDAKLIRITFIKCIKQKNNLGALHMFSFFKKGKNLLLNPSVINTGVEVDGNVTSDGEITIDGIIHGDVIAETIVIGLNGKINGQIKAQTVEIYGSIEGKIQTGRLFLASTARVIGNIHHDTLEMETGAYIEGDCRRKGGKPC